MAKSTVILISKLENDVHKWLVVGLFVKTLKEDNIKVFVNVLYVGVDIVKSLSCIKQG